MLQVDKRKVETFSHLDNFIGHRAKMGGAGIIVTAMMAKSKGKVRVCTDMTEDTGTVIERDKLCL